MPTARKKAASPAAPARKTTSKGPRTRASKGPGRAEAPIVLAGPPGLLRTAVSVENAATQRVAVRAPALHRDGHASVTGTGVAVIAPGATVEVPVSFRVEPGTAPGEYAAEVEVGGVRRTAVVRVEPHPSLQVSPRRVLAEVGRSTWVLTVTNDGNVPIPLAALVRGRTDDGGPDPGPDVELAIADPPTVDPGATTTLTGRLTVPRDLDPTRRHLARLPVGTADLDVTILPRTASE